LPNSVSFIPGILSVKIYFAEANSGHGNFGSGVGHSVYTTKGGIYTVPAHPSVWIYRDTI